MAKERRPESTPEATKSKAPVTYQMSEQPSTRVQEEEFAKRLRLARYLAAGGSPASRPLEPVPEAKTPKRGYDEALRVLEHFLRQGFQPRCVQR